MRRERSAVALALGLACAVCIQGCSSPDPVPPPGMVLVKPGKFRMGYAGEDAQPTEKQLRDVELVKMYFLDMYEVTNEQYLNYCEISKAPLPKDFDKLLVDGKLSDEKKTLPVVNVTQNDAAAYATWFKKRLPTEEEWEFAARGPNSFLYPWGNEWADGKANNFDAKNGGAVRVGRYTDGKGPFGTYDQAGNVWEWTSSQDSKDNAKFVIKGGSFVPVDPKPRCSLSGRKEGSVRASNIGFRCAMEVVE